MALVKNDHQLEQVLFRFDAAGDVIGLEIQVNMNVLDDVTNEELTRLRETVDVFPDLTAAQQAVANTVGRKLDELAKEL